MPPFFVGMPQAEMVANGGGGGGGASTDFAVPASIVSSTNTVENNVDESDLLKTDGEYLYVVKGGSTQYNYAVPDIAPNVILPADNRGIIAPPPPKSTPPQVEIYQLDPTTAAAKLLNTLTIKDTQAISGIYINVGSDNIKRLLVVGSQYRMGTNYSSEYTTQVFAYDITQPSQASAAWNFEIEGYNNATRVLNNRLYLLTRRNFNIPGYSYGPFDDKTAATNADAVAKLNIDDIMPKTKINNESAAVVTADQCAVPVTTDTQSYFDMGLTSIVGIDLNDPTKTQAFCTLENSNDVYVSSKSLYMTKPAYDGTTAYTIIHKLALTDTAIEYRASGSVNGTLGSRSTAFSTNEYDDKLRIFTTEYRYDLRSSTTKHLLFVLAEDSEQANHLKILSQLPNAQHPETIGKPNELLHGVRFFGDYAYAVTFQRTDPLYVFNLKDAANPFIEGALEIPGFSDYLHPIDDNTLLGIGRDTREQNGIVRMQGVKLGLFDVSDKTKPKLLNEIVLGDQGSETPVLNDYKALTMITNAQDHSWRLAMPVAVRKNPDASPQPDFYPPLDYCGLALYEIKNDAEHNSLRINASGTLKTESAQHSPWYNCNLHQARSAFVDDAVYFTESDNVWSALWTAPSTLIANSPRAIQSKQWSDNKAKWLSKNAIAYHYNYQLKGILNADLLKPLTFTVEDGVIAQVRYVDSGDVFTSKPPALFNTVDEMFDRIGGALDSHLDIDVTYDAELGYPTHVAIDDNPYAAGKDFDASLSALAITETLSADKIVDITGYLNSVGLEKSNGDREILFTIKSDANALVDIWNTRRFQILLSLNILSGQGRVTVSGYWRGPANETSSRFIATNVVRAQ